MTAPDVYLNIHFVTDPTRNNNDEDWAFGDVWKQGSPDDTGTGEPVRFMEVLRGDTGRGFDDSLMLDMVGYLGSLGIRATYDSFSLGMEPAAINTYVLKVEEGKEEEAVRLLKEKSNMG